MEPVQTFAEEDIMNPSLSVLLSLWSQVSSNASLVFLTENICYKKAKDRWMGHII